MNPLSSARAAIARMDEAEAAYTDANIAGANYGTLLEMREEANAAEDEAGVYAIAAIRVLPDGGVQHEGAEFTLAQVAAFLDGTEPLDGLWFGEESADGAPYWWRKHLSAAIRATPAQATRVGEWIPVGERLPEGYALVLALNPRGAGLAYYQIHDGGTDAHKAGHWYEADHDSEFYAVTHWMPIPAPPAATQYPAAVVGNGETK